ncbi:hypothetical protein EXD82_09785 [Peptacetobacter hominis]|uniref:Uncharacterized protein n=1 Tax=Peptacetobacter hominis TaxID=2743610 RepID=A0A544QT13_9FIRM|nr:hypothetical protein [Peptacetobacter hominis]TQQ83177.1 hypothetical protein EXD82_09785 [Peptacetobacter hominis]
MVALDIVNENRKSVKIRSSEIKNILEMKEDIEICQDISDTIKEKDVFVFDCQLERRIFALKSEIEAMIMETLGEAVPEEDGGIYFQDVSYYIKALSDEIEEEIQEEYIFDNVRCHFSIYNVSQNFDDFKFVFIVAFKDIDIHKLNSIADVVANRLLRGKSKFYS